VINEGHPAYKKTHAIYTQKFFSGTSGGKTQGKPANSVSQEKGCLLKCRW